MENKTRITLKQYFKADIEFRDFSEVAIPPTRSFEILGWSNSEPADLGDFMHPCSAGLIFAL
jgi:hypothetical protein